MEGDLEAKPRKSSKKDKAQEREALRWMKTEELDFDERPDTVVRLCTDVHHALIFGVLFCMWVACVIRVGEYGDLNRLQAFSDGEGNLCLFDSAKPFLFFCKNASAGEGFDLDHPICREACPDGISASTDSLAALRACGSLDYATHPQMGMVCEVSTVALPVDDVQVRALASFVDASRLAVLARIVMERWRSLVGCSLISVAASWAMLLILEEHAGRLIRLGLLALTGSALVCACYLTGSLGFLGLVPAPHAANGLAGALLFLVGFFCLCILASMGGAVETATDCIQLACRCVMQTPSLRMHPVYMFVAHLGVNLISAWACLMLLSYGKKEVFGDHVGFYMSTLCKLTLVFLLFMWYWLHQCIFAMSALVTSYSSVIWYFNGAEQEGLPRCLIFKAYWVACRYHIGTVTLGGFVVATSTPLRMVLGLLVSWTSLKGNFVSRLAKNVCCYLGDLSEAVMPLSKMAFVDVAMYARPFYDASRGAQVITQRGSDAMTLLSGATWVFQFVGLMAIGKLGGIAMLIYTTEVVHDDPVVQLIMCGAGVVVAISTAMPFVLIFDTVADCIFYCAELEEMGSERRQRSKKREVGTIISRNCGWLDGDEPVWNAFGNAWDAILGAADDEETLSSEEYSRDRGPEDQASADAAPITGRGKGRR